MHGYRIVLTADKSVMNKYSDGLFYGFLVTAPHNAGRYLSFGRLLRFILKDPPSHDDGKAVIAPQGLRRVEAALLDSGVIEPDDLIVAAPQRLEDVIGPETEVIGVSAIDPLGMGPASTTFSGPYGLIPGEPSTAYYFRELITSDVVQGARRRGAYLIVGGPGAWQISLDKMREYGIDVVVDGEAEIVFPKLVKHILDGGKLETPTIIKVPMAQYPTGDRIPLLRGATVGGVVEVSRGCGRGCSFCVPNLRRLRHRKLEDIIHDVKVNVESGQFNICLHAEDIFQYGGTPFRPNYGKVVELFKEVRGVDGVKNIGISHAALSSIASSPKTVKEISEILGLDRRHWMGFQTGIETGSPRLMEIHMRFKPYPFSPEDWPEVVERAFAISEDNGWVPCATLVINLPGEREEDVIRTVELVEKLRPYRSFIVPLLYVPMGESFQPSRPMHLIRDAAWYHIELYRAVWRHNMRWLKELAWDYSSWNDLPARFAIRTLVRIIRWFIDRRVERLFEERIEELRKSHDGLTAMVRKYERARPELRR